MFVRLREKGKKILQSPSPALGEGFRVRVFGKVPPHISQSITA